MGLRVNTNVAAIGARRHLRASNLDLSKTFERLSSGLRINRAADDAAGLAISEKLRSQIRGYTQAVRNAQDGISLIQTAEGAINETINILQRIRELAVQAANDTNTHNDRLKIQEEIIQLRTELSRIANTTEFNTRKLLDGSLAAAIAERSPLIDIKQNFRAGDTTGPNPDIHDFIVPDYIVDGIGTGAFVTNAIDTDIAYQLKFVALDVPITTGNASARAGIGLQVWSSQGDKLITFSSVGLAGETTITLTNLYNTVITVNGMAMVSIDLNFTQRVDITTIRDAKAAVITLDLSSIGKEDIGKVAVVNISARRRAVTTDSGLTFHVGPNEGQIVRVNVDELTAKRLRLEDVSVVGTLDPRTAGARADSADLMRSEESIGIIDDALDQVNSLRARLGAVQNRLESTIRSMEISHENLSASESRIRDADIAKETAELTRSQILVQAGTAVLAQANVSPQSALALLQ